MYFPFRYSLNIEKQILWILLAYFLSKKKYKSVLDIGCGRGDNIKMIRFKKYLGIDIDTNRVNDNSEKFKNKSIKFLKKDITSENFINLNHDLVLIIQVFTNTIFDNTKIMKSLSNAVKASNKSFIFNTSLKNKNQLLKIEKLLHENNLDFDISKIEMEIN